MVKNTNQNIFYFYQHCHHALEFVFAYESKQGTMGYMTCMVPDFSLATKNEKYAHMLLLSHETWLTQTVNETVWEFVFCDNIQKLPEDQTELFFQKLALLAQNKEMVYFNKLKNVSLPKLIRLTHHWDPDRQLKFVYNKGESTRQLIDYRVRQCWDQNQITACVLNLSSTDDEFVAWFCSLLLHYDKLSFNTPVFVAPVGEKSMKILVDHLPDNYLLSALYSFGEHVDAKNRIKNVDFPTLVKNNKSHALVLSYFACTHFVLTKEEYQFFCTIIEQSSNKNDLAASFFIQHENNIDMLNPNHVETLLSFTSTSKVDAPVLDMLSMDNNILETFLTSLLESNNLALGKSFLTPKVLEKLNPVLLQKIVKQSHTLTDFVTSNTVSIIPTQNIDTSQAQALLAYAYELLENCVTLPSPDAEHVKYCIIHDIVKLTKLIDDFNYTTLPVSLIVDPRLNKCDFGPSRNALYTKIYDLNLTLMIEKILEAASNSFLSVDEFIAVLDTATY